MSYSFKIALFLYIFILNCKPDSQLSKSDIQSVDKLREDIKFNEVIVESQYSFDTFARKNKGCWYPFDMANYRDFETLKVPTKRGFAKLDFVYCNFFFELKSDGRHTWYSSNWYGEYPKTFTKMTCKQNRCEFEFGNSSLDGKTFTPKQGVIKFTILDDRHIELVDYPKDVFTEIEDIRGIYRYFPSDHNLLGKAFCQMNKEELLKNREIYPPKEIECIDPDDVREAEKNGKTE